MVQSRGILLASFIAGLWSTVVLATPEIHFTEYRILLTQGKQSADYEIFNQGTSPARCKTDFVDFHISQHGQLQQAQQENLPQTSAQHILRSSPKNVIVAPMASQKVKVVARKLRQQQSGEWVSYLNIRCSEEGNQTAAGLHLKPNFVYNIPVVVRVGDLSATAKWQQARLHQQNGQWQVQAVLNRTGQRSLYGDVYVSDESGKTLGKLVGLSHYQQTQQLPVNIRLTDTPKGAITLEFKENPRFGGNQTAIETVTRS